MYIQRKKINSIKSYSILFFSLIFVQTIFISPSYTISLTVNCECTCFGRGMADVGITVSAPFPGVLSTVCKGPCEAKMGTKFAGYSGGGNNCKGVLK
ncbi:MAG: hypothetical protein H0U75_07170 [Legionella sp.]|nr:hypothetical protein [Legionella sp.]